MMSQFCMDMQDQSPNRPGGLSLRYENNPNDFSDLKTNINSRGYPVLKRSDSSDRDKSIPQFQNDCGNNLINPTAFLNPKDVPPATEQFAEQLTKSFDKIKSERDGSLIDDQLIHRSSNSPPLAAFAPAKERSSNPSTPKRVKLCNPVDNNVDADRLMVPVTYSAVVPVIATNISPPSTNGDSTSPVSPALENPNNRFSVATPNTAPPRYTLPPLRTSANNSGEHFASLTNMMVSGTTDDPSNNSLADPTVPNSLNVNQLINPTTDGFAFQHSTDPNAMMDGRMNDLLGQTHLPNLFPYDRQNFAHPTRQNEYLTPVANYQAPHHQQQQHHQAPHTLMLGSKRPLQNPPMNSLGPKRGRRRHEPTIAAAQALINASSNGAMVNNESHLSYPTSDFTAMPTTSLKMEQQPQQVQTPMNTTAVGAPPRRGNNPVSMGTAYESTPESSIPNMEQGMDKVERKRERNRIAARRCRERKISKIQSLEAEVQNLSTFTESLRAQLDTAQKEKEQLRSCIEQLAETVPGVRDQLDSLMLSHGHQHLMQSQGVSPNQAHRN